MSDKELRKKIKQEFDWKFYVSYYHDLNHVTDEFVAWKHYKHYGFFEKRHYNKETYEKQLEEEMTLIENISNDDPYILIVMPTYNRSEYIEKSIKYMNNQTYKNFKFLIIDDGSDLNHKTLFYKLKDKYKTKTKLLFMENDINLHVAKTLNKGIEYLFNNDKFTHFTWISDDNVYYSNFLSDLISDNSYFKYTSYNIQELDNTICRNNSSYKEFNDILNNFNGCASFMWTKEAIKNIGNYDETIPGCEDFEYLLRTFKLNELACKFSLLPTMKYVRHNLSGFEIDKKNIMSMKNNIINQYKKSISIVMAYYNRKPQTIETLNGFERMYAGKYNFEVIIVDDNSNDENRLEEAIKLFSFPINLIVISEEEKGDRINPCTAYNKGFKQAKGDIIIIQNPECYHVGDILKDIILNLTEQDYFSYSCYTANNFEITNKLITSSEPYKLIQNKDFDDNNFKLIGLSWYNHPTILGRNVGYHFCSAIHKSKLELIGGFDESFSNGYCFDDDELLLSIKYNLQLDIKIIHPDNGFVIHQYHTRNDSFNIELEDDNHPIKKKWVKNKKLFEEMKSYHETKSFNYPKLLHLYWDGSPLSFLNFITVLSFNEYHKFWKINIFMPTTKTETISWQSNEQKEKYTGKSYFNNLYTIPNVLVHKIDLNKIGFHNDASEVIKSDYFRYFILQKHGGLWSDFDIIYTACVEDKMNFKEETVIFRCNIDEYYYYPIGLFICRPQNNFFNNILNNCNIFYDSNRYQTIGADMWNKLFPSKINNLYLFDKGVKVCNNNYYLPYQYHELDKTLLSKDKINLPKNNIGIHWFNGDNNMKIYNNIFNSRINTFSPLNNLDIYIKKYLDNTTYNIIIFYNNQYNKLKLFLKNLEYIYKNEIICLHIICNNKVFPKLNTTHINIKFYNNIEETISNINTEFLFFQDIIINHKTNILNILLNELIIDKSLDFVACNKKIVNVKISKQFKEIIEKNKIPDIILFKKIDFNKKIYLNEYWNQFGSYKIITTYDIEYLFPKKIPKKIHFYWDGSKGDYLTSLTIKSFVYNNPDWDVYLWMPQLNYKTKILWEKQEFIPPHTLNYTDIDFINYKYFEDELGISIKYIDYFNLGLTNNISEVIKSDIFRWKILSEIGGVWSDMDILFADRIEKTDFERCKCKSFHDIELVVSQYQKNIQDIPNPIDFYYIGFLMSSKNNKFYKIMYEESIKNISELSYQGVGGDLIKSYFGLYDGIAEKIENYFYANLQCDSIYHYWWADLKNLYINNCQENIHEYILTNNNIIGYHWFRGVHLSKIYTHFYNYENKIQNYESFKGPLFEWTKYYEKIFNEHHIIKTQKKISIVMGYINRLKQLEVTLNTIFKSLHVNFEVIIVNDGDEDLNYLSQKFNTDKIIVVDNKNKTYINPCNSYNIGIKKSSGDIVILQNPECCHIGDLLATTNCLLKENDYLAFSCYYLDNYTKNDKLYEILESSNNLTFWEKEKIENLFKFTLECKYDSILPKENNGWSSHHFYKPNYLHFCVAIYKSDLLKINCFGKEYKDGICFDDDDLVRKISLNNINMFYYPISENQSSYPALPEFSSFVIHQHHDRFSYSDNNIIEKWKVNKNIFIENNPIFIKKYLELFINKQIKELNLSVFNGTIVKYVNNFYEIVFNDNNNNNNNIVFNFDFPIDNYEYIFNGGNMSLKNNIKELFNNCDYEIFIFCDDTNDIVCNDITVHKNDNFFIYNGKLIENSLIIKNVPLKTKLKISCKLKKVNFIDNTIFIEK